MYPYFYIDESFSVRDRAEVRPNRLAIILVVLEERGNNHPRKVSNTRVVLTDLIGAAAWRIP
jgi:hypothetical protein